MSMSNSQEVLTSSSGTKISPGTIGSIYEWQRFVAHSYASENNI
jgi:hypothetical protein